MLNLPNQLTLFRVLVIPLMGLVFYTQYEWRFLASAALFCLAGITDALDGYYSRKYNLATPFGAFLDPVARHVVYTPSHRHHLSRNCDLCAKRMDGRSRQPRHSSRIEHW